MRTLLKNARIYDSTGRDGFVGKILPPETVRQLRDGARAVLNGTMNTLTI